MQDNKTTVSERQLVKYQKYYTEEGFWSKIKKLAIKAGGKVLYYALLLFYTAIAPTTPMAKKSIIFGALGYLILPLDLIPDALPLVGFSDDLGALIACVKAVTSCITPELEAKAETKVKELQNT